MNFFIIEFFFFFILYTNWKCFSLDSVQIMKLEHYHLRWIYAERLFICVCVCVFMCIRMDVSVLCWWFLYSIQNSSNSKSQIYGNDVTNVLMVTTKIRIQVGKMPKLHPRFLSHEVVWFYMRVFFFPLSFLFSQQQCNSYTWKISSKFL